MEKFRQKGATSPEKAMTAQELDLPPRFEEAMHRRLGQTGIFVEVNGKYYLNEERLKQIQKQRQQQQGSGGGGGDGRPWRAMFMLRIARVGTLLAFMILLLTNVFVQNWEIRVVSTVFLTAWIILFIAYIAYASRIRKRWQQNRLGLT